MCLIFRPKVLDYVTSVCPAPTQTPPICPRHTDNTTFSQTWCDGQSMNIKCPTNTTIEIICAFYGLDPSLENAPCGISRLTYDPVCYLASSFDQIKSECSNKSSCSIRDITEFFINSDPCFELDKQLHVQWWCVVRDDKFSNSL